MDSYIQGIKGEKGRRGHQVRRPLFSWQYWDTREGASWCRGLGIGLDQHRKPERKPVGPHFHADRSSEL